MKWSLLSCSMYAILARIQLCILRKTSLLKQGSMSLSLKSKRQEEEALPKSQHNTAEKTIWNFPFVYSRTKNKVLKVPLCTFQSLLVVTMTNLWLWVVVFCCLVDGEGLVKNVARLDLVKRCNVSSGSNAKPMI